MANQCLPHVQACATRVTRLTSDGSPDIGANNLYVSDALVSFSATPEIEEGDEFIVKNACGSVCVNFKDCDRIKRLNVEMTICTPDPELTELLSGGVVLTSGARVGWGMPFLSDPDCPLGVSIELWSKQINSDGSVDPTYPYARWLFPKVFLTPGVRTFENGPLSNPFTGFALENSQWLDGPLNDWPVGSDRAMQWLPDTTLPTTSCGYQSVSFS